MELVAVSQLSSYQPAKPFLLVGHGIKPFSKNTRVHRLWDTPRQRTFLKILDIKPGQTSSDGSDPKELLSVDHPIIKCPEIHIHDKTILKIKLF